MKITVRWYWRFVALAIWMWGFVGMVYFAAIGHISEPTPANWSLPLWYLLWTFSLQASAVMAWREYKANKTEERS